MAVTVLRQDTAPREAPVLDGPASSWSARIQADQVCTGPPQASGDGLVAAVRGGSTARPDGEVAAGDDLELAEAITQLRRGFEALETEPTDALADLMVRVEEVEDAAPGAGRRPGDEMVLALRGHLSAESLWQEPGDWVGWIRNRPLAKRIPECWANHPGRFGNAPLSGGQVLRGGVRLLILRRVRRCWPGGRGLSPPARSRRGINCNRTAPRSIPTGTELLMLRVLNAGRQQRRSSALTIGSADHTPPGARMNAGRGVVTEDSASRQSPGSWAEPRTARRWRSGSSGLTSTSAQLQLRENRAPSGHHCLQRQSAQHRWRTTHQDRTSHSVIRHEVIRRDRWEGSARLYQRQRLRRRAQGGRAWHAPRGRSRELASLATPRDEDPGVGAGP